MRTVRIAVVGSLILVFTVGCADENFTRDVEARWCELAGADCAPPPPLQPPVLNPPNGGDHPAGPVYVIPPTYAPPSAPSAEGR